MHASCRLVSHVCVPNSLPSPRPPHSPPSVISNIIMLHEPPQSTTCRHLTRFEMTKLYVPNMLPWLFTTCIHLACTMPCRFKSSYMHAGCDVHLFHSQHLSCNLFKYSLSRKEQLAIVHDPDVFRFAIVRSPLERAVSAWKSKLACDGW